MTRAKLLPRDTCAARQCRCGHIPRLGGQDVSILAEQRGIVSVLHKP
jgi:hypothetical protein